MLTLTHVGGPTVLAELDGWRILTDPTFDPPGRQYGFGWGSSSVKVTGPAVAVEDIGPVDVVLLSHDHHADNLDDLGRTYLRTALTVVTTRAGARRIRTPDVRGLSAGGTTSLTAPGRPELTVTATPCRHGPPLSRPIAGPVVGFALSVAGRPGTALWMTGDTVLHRPLRRFAGGLDADVALLHLGRVRFRLTGPARYSMDSRDAAELLRLLEPRVAVPVHYEGWSHFSEPQDELHATLDALVPALRSRVTWLEPGTPGPDLTTVSSRRAPG